MAREWQIGDRWSNRWLIRKIFRGGMGVVYIVHDQEWNEAFAAKTFQDEVFARSPSIAPMFTREARAWIELDRHPNIAQASFVQEIEGKPVLFLEYVSGGDLSSWIGTPRLMDDPKRLLGFALNLCDGMIHARSKGVEVHRDLKPQNCLITESGTLKVTDFGLAKVVDDAPEAAGGAAGTPTHMPPEQFTDASRAGVTADIYSFGVVLYQMLTGKLPFRGRSWADYERMHTSEPPPAWEVGHPQMQGLLYRCLEKAPAARYQNFEQLRPLLAALYEEMTGEKAPRPATGAALDATHWLNKGASLAALGLSAHAQECYERGLEAEPQMGQLWSNKANLVREAGRHKEALDLYDRALALDPTLELTWHNKGVTLSMLNRPEEALAALDKALELNRWLVPSWCSRGVALQTLGRPDEAMASFGKARSIDPTSAAAQANYGKHLSRRGRYEEALECFDKALETETKMPALWIGRGDALSSLGRHKEALGAYDKAVNLDRDYDTAWLAKGKGHQALGELERALECFRTVTKRSRRDAAAWYHEGVVLAEMERHQEALAAFDAGLEWDSRDGNLWQRKGHSHGALGQDSEAFAAYTTAVMVDPEDANAWHNRGIAARVLGRIEEALDCHNEALARDPSLEQGWLAKANALADLGHDEEAIAAYDEAIRRNPEFTSAWFSKGATLGNAERYKEALACFERAAELGDPRAAASAAKCRAELSSGNPRAQEQAAAHEMGIRLVGQGRMAEAIECFDKALAIEPQPSFTWFGKGVALGKLERHEEALFCYERATALDPANAAAWLNRGVTLYLFHNRYAEAIPCLERAVKLGSEMAPRALERCRERMAEAAPPPEAPLAVATRLEAEGKLDEALAVCEKALETDGENAGLWARKAEVLCGLKRLDEAGKACERALDLQPGLPAAWFAKGRVNLEQGWDEAAIIWFKGGLEYAPKDPLGWFRQGRALEKTSQLDEAVEAYRESVAADPMNGEHWRYHLNLLEEMGRTEELLDGCRTATTALPGDAGLWYRRGRVNREAGRVKEAAEAFDRSAALGDRDAAEAAEECRESLAPPPATSAEDWCEKGMALLKAEKSAEAIECFDKALAIDGDHVHSLFARAIALGNMKRYREAEAGYSRVVELDPEMAMAAKCRDELRELLRVRGEIGEAWHDRGAAHFREGRRQEALEAFDNALAENAEAPHTLVAKGMTLSQLGRHGEALECAERAIKAHAEFAPAYCLKGAELVMLHTRLEEALAALEKSQSLGYGPATDGIALCRQAMASRDAAAAPPQNPDAEALARFERGLAANPDSLEDLFGRAMALGKLGRVEDELAAWDAFLRRAPQMAGAWFNKGLTLNGKLHRRTEALECFDRAAALGHPSAAQEAAACRQAMGPPQQTPATWLQRGIELAAQQARLSEALQCFETVLTMDSRHAEAWWRRAIVLGQLGRVQDAVFSFDHALHLNPNQAGVWHAKGATLANAGRYQEALPCFQQAVALGNAAAQQGVAFCRRALGMAAG